MEGKKYRALDRDFRGISGVVGQVIMIAIVVLAFSGISLTIFSDEKDVNPPHTPHTDLRENINVRNSTVQIVHSGGDAIDLDEIKVVLSVKEKQTVFNMSDQEGVKVLHPDESKVTNGVFMYGDCIKINTAVKGVTFTSDDSVDMFFIHTPSRQVIQRAVLQRASAALPYWFTPDPYGNVYSDSTDGGWLPMGKVGVADDGSYTHVPVPNDAWVYQQFDFGIDADEMGISNPLKKVELKIIFRTHDCSPDAFILSIHNGSAWTLIPPGNKGYEYNSFEDCKNNKTVFNITPYVDNTEKLEKLIVRFSASGNSNSGTKYLDIDFVGIHIEF